MNDAKKRILARRAQFVAAALASLSADACGKEEAVKPDASEVTPAPCLSLYYPPPEPPEAGATAATTPDAAAPDAAPHPCLGGTSPARDASAPRPCLSAPPRPCLKVAPGESDL